MPVNKKIILAGSIPPPYHGSSIYFYNLLNSKIRNEFDVSHLDLSDHRDLDNLSRLDFTNVKLALKNIITMFRLLRKTDPELVYIPVASNFLPYLRDGLLILTAAYFSKAKIVIHLHEGGYFRSGFYDKAPIPVKYFIKKSLGKADTAIVLSENLKFVFNGLVRNTEVCNNGISQRHADNSIQKKSSPDDLITVGFLGNLFESKGVLDVLNAAEEILKKCHKVKFRFAGAWSDKEGNTEEKAYRLINENGLTEHVEFTGVVTGKDKDKFLECTDIFLFPSWYKHEGFPLVIIEAMSASCPVISVKDTGAISDIIVDGDTGFLIDKKRPDQIAESVIKLIKDPGLRMEMGKRGRERYEQRYTLDSSINRIISIFNKVLN